MSTPTEKHSPIAVSKSERLLSWILAAFLLLALSWGYVNIDDQVRESRSAGAMTREQAVQRIEVAEESFSRSIGLLGELSESKLFEIEGLIHRAESDRDAARERYRTTLDEGDPNPTLKRAYLAREADLNRLEARQTELEARQRAAKAKLRSYRREHSAALNAADQRLQSYGETTDRIIFILRLLMSLATLGMSVWLLRWVTERVPRAQPLAQAGVIAGSLMLLTLIVDYGEISFDFATVGPLGMALLGIVLTVGAFFGLQRYLRKRRPDRRLRAGECAACGYPGGTSNFCESCGAQLRTTCQSCGASRRTGVERCGACGAA